MRKNIKNQKGYAILFTVVLVSIISLIGIGLSNMTFKQLLISSGAKDSQLAFYESDMATECALYADNNSTLFSELPAPAVFSCGVDRDGDPYQLELSGPIVSGEKQTYILNSPSSLDDTNKPCFSFIVEKTDLVDFIKTRIESSGYNVCNRNGVRAVERTIEVNY